MPVNIKKYLKQYYTKENSYHKQNKSHIIGAAGPLVRVSGLFVPWESDYSYPKPFVLGLFIPKTICTFVPNVDCSHTR